MFLEISQNSQENTYAGVSFLIKLQASGTGDPGKFLRTPFLTEDIQTFFKCKINRVQQFWSNNIRDYNFLIVDAMKKFRKFELQEYI